MPRRGKLCSYCGTGFEPGKGKKDGEHVVGRQFFPEPSRRNLITVPSCRRCNEEPKEDEDYFRSLLGWVGPDMTETMVRMSEAVDSSLRKDHGLRHAWRAGVITIERFDPLRGVQREIAQRVAWPRVQRVLEKWVRGLYFFEHGVRLPRETTFDVCFTRALGEFEDMVGPTLRSSRSWPEVFDYWHSRDESDPTKTKWGFLIWGGIGFVAFTNQPLPAEAGDPVLFG